jgi:hypothetical protein
VNARSLSGHPVIKNERGQLTIRTSLGLVKKGIEFFLKIN